MSDTTVTIRGVDANVWKEFQRGIVSLHGNLYGNIGQEATNALKLWFDRYRGMKSAISIPANRISVSYDNIGGLKEEIKMVKEKVEVPLRRPELLRWLNLIPPKGILIHGPPGTGKNILARAATAAAKANLFVLSIERMLTDFTEQGVRGVFQKAKEDSPSVILIPDLKMLAPGQKASDEMTDQMISWLLSEIDALEEFSQVIIIGIASSPEDLESSLRQRFQEEIEISFPDKQGRYEILKILTKKMPVADDVDLQKLADMTDQYHGGLLWRICQKAARNTLRRTLEHEKIIDKEITQEKLEKIKIKMDDFLQALGSVPSAT